MEYPLIGGTSFENCSNTGKIVSLGEHVGGILGYWYYGTTTIINCINYGDIEVTCYGGGILGHNMSGTSNIYNCGNYGTVSARENLEASLVYSVGGICGNTGSGSGGGDKGIIANCYNLGIIKDAQYVGGILGCHHMGTVLIENVANLKNVSNGITSCAAIVGARSANDQPATVNNSYYLSVTSDKGMNTSTDPTISFEMSDIQSIISKLNKYIVDNNKEDYLVWSYDEKENKINFTEPNE